MPGIGGAGTLVVTLSMNNDPLLKGFAGATRAHNVWRQSARGGAGDARNLQRGVLELSRGFEDFAAVVGTTGVAGGLRAASNNITQFLAILAPGLGAIGGFSVALGTLLIPKLLATKDAAKDTEDAIKSMLAAAESEAKQNAEREEFGKLVTSERRPEDFATRRRDLEKELGDLEPQIRELERRRDVRRDRRPGRFLTEFDRGRTLNADQLSADDKALAEIKALEEELAPKLERRRILQERITRLAQEERDARQQQGGRLQGADLHRSGAALTVRGTRDEQREFRRLEEDQRDARREREFREVSRGAALDLRSELEGEIDPKQAQRRRIIEETESRRALIRRLAIPGDEKVRLDALAKQSAIKRIEDIDKPQGKSDQRGSGALAGSRDALDHILNAQRQTLDPSVKVQKEHKEVSQRILKAIEKRKSNEVSVSLGAFKK